MTRTFYFTGGTPLAAFYLRHRYSEDLDFFSETEVDVMPLDVFFKRLKQKLAFISVDFQQNMNRNLFFLNFKDGEVVKLEFTFFPFPRISKGPKEFGLEVDSVEDIAVNKLFTIYQRMKARDYIDLYCICEKYHFTVRDLIAKARLKFDWHIDPVQLATQFIKSGQADDLPRMIASVKENQWRGFFEAEAKKLKPEIFTG